MFMIGVFAKTNNDVTFQRIFVNLLIADWAPVTALFTTLGKSGQKSDIISFFFPFLYVGVCVFLSISLVVYVFQWDS